ncbi:hypothetical protein MO973_22930 [Paenibacillus sp. TRM 82003]|nr:hypothetical protein [Paenibacillus sp. TRM 82003]
MTVLLSAQTWFLAAPVPEAQAAAGQKIMKLEAGADPDGGGSFALALDDNGALWAWGQNNGTFGNGSHYSSPNPTKVPGLSNIGDIAAGPDFAIAMEDGGGRLWAWGDNSSGQLGIGTGDYPDIPVEINLQTLGLPAAKQVDAGQMHAVMLSVTGAVYAWGANGSGELGTLNTSGTVLRPSPVMKEDGTPLTNVKEIEAGNDFTLAVTEDGEVYTWGQNHYDQSGNGAVGYYITEATKVASLSGVKQVYSSAASWHAFAVTVSGAVYGWGHNDDGQLGVNSDGFDVPIPELISATMNPKHMSMGEDHSIAIDGSGNVQGVGLNGENNGVLLGADRTAFTTLTSPSTAVSVMTTNEAVYILYEDGTVAVWGNNEDGQLGVGTVSDSDDLPLTQTTMKALQQWGYNVTFRLLDTGTEAPDDTITCSVVQAYSDTNGRMPAAQTGEGSCTFFDLQDGRHDIVGTEEWNMYKAYARIPPLIDDIQDMTVHFAPEWLPTLIQFKDKHPSPNFIAGHIHSDAFDEVEIDANYRLHFVDATGAKVGIDPAFVSEESSFDLPKKEIPERAKGLRLFVDDASTDAIESIPMVGWLPLLDEPYVKPEIYFEDADKDDGIQGKLVIDDTNFEAEVISKYRIYHAKGQYGEQIIELGTIAAHDPVNPVRSISIPEVVAGEYVAVEFQDAHGNKAHTVEVKTFDDISEIEIPTIFSFDLPGAMVNLYDDDFDAGELGGSLEAVFDDPGEGVYSFFGYRAYFLDSDGDRLQGIVASPEDRSEVRMYLPKNLAIPEEAVSIGVYPYNMMGIEADATVPSIIWDDPVFRPQHIEFTDTDPKPSSIQQVITWDRAQDETVIDAYEIVALYEGFETSIITTEAVSGKPTYSYTFPAPIPEQDAILYEIRVKKGTYPSRTIGTLFPYDDTSDQKNLEPGAPSALPSPSPGLDYYGEVSGSTFTGYMTWEKVAGAKGYQIYFTNDSGTRLASIAFRKEMNDYDEQSIGVFRTVPEGATHIAVHTVDVDGLESVEALRFPLYSKTTDARPKELSFFDILPATGQIAGTLKWQAGVDESEVTSYKVFYMDSIGGRLGEALDSVPVNDTGVYRLELPSARAAFGTATDLVVAAMSGDTELAYAHLPFYDSASLDTVRSHARSEIKPTGEIAFADLFGYVGSSARINLAGGPGFDREDYKVLLSLIDPISITPLLPE